MNKTELAAKVSAALDVSQAKGELAITAVFDAIQEALAAGDNVSLIGFGAFSVKDRAARTGRNPQTGEEMKIKACKAAHFKVGKKLKEAINE